MKEEQKMSATSLQLELSMQEHEKQMDKIQNID